MSKATQRLAMVVLWPSFLTAAMAEGCFFSLFAPDALWAVTPLAVYTIGFFCFWLLCALASMLTCYLVMVPADHRAPF